MPMSFVVDRDGEYRATVRGRGGRALRDRRVGRARRRGRAVRDTAYVRAAPDDGEHFDAAMRADAAEAHRRGHRRPLLHGGQRVVAGRRHHLSRARRDGGAGEGPLGHAHRPGAPAGRPRGRRVVPPPPGGAAMTPPLAFMRRPVAVLAVALARRRSRRAATCSSSWASAATTRTPSASTGGHRRSSTRPGTATRCRRTASSTSARIPPATRRASAADRRATPIDGRRREAGRAGPARRPRVHRSHRPRRVGHGRGAVQPARARTWRRPTSRGWPGASPRSRWSSSTRRAPAADSWRRCRARTGPCITATRTDGERNQTRFGEFFAEALASDDARHGQGRPRVHARGVHVGTPARDRIVRARRPAAAPSTPCSTTTATARGPRSPASRAATGRVARTLFLSAGASRAVPGADADPEVRALIEQREALEERIAALKASKEKTDPAALREQELERLLIDLARTNAAIKEKVKR
ncbi:MAG: hypothetical protein MZV70_74445 [Desulfobacterales bacterium]|nr:hypothetical protein [Desulfobacterales bacterium]